MIDSRSISTAVSNSFIEVLGVFEDELTSSCGVPVSQHISECQ